MKVLILACNMGGGHFSAAYALAEECERRGIEHETLDSLTAFAGKGVSDNISKLYTGIVKRTPRLFYFAYRAGDAISSNKRKSPIYLLNKRTRKKMLQYIEENAFDAVIVTHLFPAQTLTALRAEGKLKKVLTVAVATDYTCIPFWEETNLDYYISPHRELIREYADKGMPEEKLKPFGIPVSRRFLVHTPGKTAREQLGLPADGTLVLVMTGSMGYGHVEELTAELLRKAEKEENTNIVVICGSNQKMFESLSEKYKDEKRLHLFGYETRIPRFMDACDVLLTKPGGLTSTEAAVHTIPLVHTTPIPGCETENAAFFEKHGMSVVADEPEKQAEEAFRLCRETKAAEAMISAQKRELPFFAAEEILCMTEELCGGGEA